jgi:hypothetical protein
VTLLRTVSDRPRWVTPARIVVDPDASVAVLVDG